jgi:hypothetical protein
MNMILNWILQNTPMGEIAPLRDQLVGHVDNIALESGFPRLPLSIKKVGQ